MTARFSHRDLLAMVQTKNKREGADVFATEARQVMAQLRVEVSIDLRWSVKVRAAARGVTMQQYVTEALVRTMADDRIAEDVK